MPGRLPPLPGRHQGKVYCRSWAAGSDLEAEPVFAGEMTGIPLRHRDLHRSLQGIREDFHRQHQNPGMENSIEYVWAAEVCELYFSGRPRKEALAAAPAAAEHCGSGWTPPAQIWINTLNLENDTILELANGDRPRQPEAS